MAQPDPLSLQGARESRVVQCGGCGLLYLNPMPEGAELAAFYPDEYYDRVVGGTDPGRPMSPARQMRLWIRQALLQRFYGYPCAANGSTPPWDGVPGWVATIGAHLERWRLRAGGRESAIIPFMEPGRLLDVGCGTGRELIALQAAGWRVTGVEISPYAAAVVRARLGCEVVVGHFDEAHLEGRQFDAVRLSHVLEHLPSPRRSLEKIRGLLRPGGLLWIEVPNAASLERHLFRGHWFQWNQPGHLYHFTPETLVRLLGEVGFRPRRVKCDARKAFFAESVADLLQRRLGVPRRAGKTLAVLARPLVYLLGAVSLGGILTVHAVREDREPAAAAAPPGSGRPLARIDHEDTVNNPGLPNH